MRITIVSILLIGLLGCEDRYRYPCQDPANWGNEECQEPKCKAMGTCASDLIKTLKKNPCGLITTEGAE